MRELARRYRAWIAPALASLLFALLSLAILPYPGLQDDELLFTGPLFRTGGTLFSMKLFRTRIPLMLMGYVGALKTWLYAGIFGIFPPSRWSVRAPMVLVGVITIWLTWIWTRRAAGSRAAAFTVALLSTDAVFIVTNTFDWGPVALQHALLMGGLVAIQSWLRDGDSKRTGSNRMLALGFFLWGLGLWDKALMIWPLAGLAVATLCVYPKELRRVLRHCRRGQIIVAAAAFLLGALPLVRYNIARHGQTASANMKLALNQIPSKIPELQYTLDGSVLLGPIVATDPGPLKQEPKTAVERISVAVSRDLGPHRRNRMLFALALSIACLVFLLRRPRLRPQTWRFLIFIQIAATVTWLQMAANAGTGGAAHHTILLWPFPCIFVGVAMAGVADRAPRMISYAIAAIVAVIVCANLLNVNEYLAELTLNGAAGAWSDASYRLAGAVWPYRSRQIGIVDWGYLNGLRMSYKGNLKVSDLSGFIRDPTMTDSDRKQVAAAIGSPDFVFIQHTEDGQLFPEVNDRLRAAALAMGYAERVQRVVDDNQGRPVFEIFRFVKAR